MTARVKAWLLALGLVLGAAFLGAQTQTVQGELKRLSRIWDGTDVWLIDSSGNGMVGDGTGPLTVDGTVTANQGGTWTVQPGNTANTTAWLQKLSQTGTDNDTDIVTFPDNEPFNQAQRGGTALIAGRCEREEPIYVNIDQTANTQLITGVAAERIYICSLHIITATAQNVGLVDGTGTTCATGPAGLEGFGGPAAGDGWNFGANGGLVLPATTQAYGRTTTNADNVCLFQSGAGQVSGGLSYVSIAP